MRAGDIVAELSVLELIALVGQARAAVDAATASRDNVYAGVRAEQIAALAAEVAKAKSKLTYLEAQLVRRHARSVQLDATRLRRGREECRGHPSARTCRQVQR